MATALVMMTDPGNPEANGRMVHALTSIAALRDADQPVAMYLHGAGVNWAGAFAERADKFTQYYGELFDDVKPLIVGSCNFCTNVRFNQTDAVTQLGLPILGDDGGHHTIADLIAAGDTVVTL